MTHEDFIHPTTGEVKTTELFEAFDRLAEENAALDFKLRQAARSEVALRKELAKQHADDPRSKEIREVLEYWIATCHKPSRTKIPMDGVRAQRVRSRLNQKFTVEDLKKAIDGAAAMPFVGPRGRSATQEPGCTRQDDLELILRDEKNVERFQGYAKEAEKTLRAVPDPIGPETREEWVERIQARTREIGAEREEREAREAEQRRRRNANREQVYGSSDIPINRILGDLHGVRAVPGNVDRWMALCPNHDDSHPSLQVTRGDTGTVLLHCFAGCDLGEICAALGREVRDLWDRSEYDMDARDYRGDTKPVVPAHLRQAMQQLLARGERAA